MRPFFSVLAFSAEILSWPFNTPPPPGYSRHHLKGASEEGWESYEVALEVAGSEPIWLDYTGMLEDGNWQGVGQGRGRNTQGAERFARLHAYLEETKGGAIDCESGSGVVDVEFAH